MNTNGNNSGDSYPNFFNGSRSLGKKKPEELFDFKWIYSILKRYTWLILACMVISTAAAYYISFRYLLPVYKSSSTLYINETSNTFPGSGQISNIITSSFGLNSSGTIITELQFFKSRELATNVAKQIMNAKYLANGELYPLLWTNYPEDSTIVSIETVAGRIQSGLTATPAEPGSNIVVVSFESYSPYEAARVVNFSINEFQELTAYKKRASARSALEFLKSEKQRVKEKLEEVENQLARFKNNEQVVQLDAQASNLVHTISSLQLKKQTILIELKAINAGIENYENQLEAIKPGLGEQLASAVGPSISAYQKRLAELQMKRYVLVSNNPELKENPNSEVRRLTNQISNLQKQIKQLSSKLVKNNQYYLESVAGASGNVTRELAAIQQNLTQLRIKKNQYQAKLRAVNSRLQNNQAFLDQVPENKIQLTRLKRQIKLHEAMYVSLSKQINEVAIWKQTQTGTGTIIDYAKVNSAPVKPNKMMWLAFGLFFGFAIPFGLVLTKEALSDKISSIDTLKKKPYPLLAVINNHNTLDKEKQLELSKSSLHKNKKISSDLITYYYNLSPLAESYRDLVNKILYLNPDKPPKSILITSADASEGKTTLTANTAVSLVENGNRVLIIDCDMRKPGIPKFFGISKEPGVMEVLFKNHDPKKTIKSSSIEGLDILTTGKKEPARPASILSSQAFKDLLDQFELEYDFILLDSAPYGIIGDVAPLIQKTDGVIITSKFGSTKNIELDHTIEKLENNSANILGLVLNWYEPEKSLDDVEVKKLYNNLYSSYYNYYDNPKKKGTYL